MNIETLKKLSKNPHYNLTEKQKAQLKMLESQNTKTMISFGAVNTHSNTFTRHDTNQKKKKIIKGNK